MLNLEPAKVERVLGGVGGQLAEEWAQLLDVVPFNVSMRVL